ncbi:MAG: hypothetical protein KDK62_05470 [Chlamydiia bacterium]|nr:hypothetical protein [Chlamydiia bacterium]
MRVTSIRSGYSLDNQQSLQGTRAAKIFSKERSQVVPVVAGNVVGWSVAGMIAVASIVGLIAASSLFPLTTLPMVVFLTASAIITALGIAIIAGISSGVAVVCLSDIKAILLECSLTNAKTPEKVAEVAARIKDDRVLGEMANEMNFHQIEVLKAGIGSKRFGKVITQIKEETPAVEAWKMIMQFHEKPNCKELVKKLHELNLNKSFRVVDALRKVYPKTDFEIEMDVPWYRSEKDTTVPRRALFTHKNESIDIPLTGPKAGLYKDSLTDGVLGVMFDQKEPVEIDSVNDFNELERLAAFAMGEIESVSVNEFIYLVKAADKWSQPELLKKLDLMHKHQPILSPEDVEELSLIQEMENLKTLIRITL